MKKKLINFLIFVFLGICGYLGYNKFFVEDCNKCSSGKDTVSVSLNMTVTPKSDSVKKENDTIK